MCFRMPSRRERTGHRYSGNGSSYDGNSALEPSSSPITGVDRIKKLKKSAGCVDLACPPFDV